MSNFVNHEFIEKVTFRDYMRVIFRQKRIIFITVVIIMLAVLTGVELQTPMYEASVKMLISAEKQVSSPFYRDLIESGDIKVALTQSEIVKSNPVIGQVVEALELDKVPFDYEQKFASPLKKRIIGHQAKRMELKLLGLSPYDQEQLKAALAMKNLRDNIEVEPVRGANIFSIKVKDFTPERAKKIANVLSRAYIIFDLEQQLAELKMKYGEKHLAVRQIKDAIFNVRITLNGLTLDAVEAIGPATVKIIEQATVPLKPIGIQKELMYLFAFLFSIIVSVILAFLAEAMDDTFKSPHEIEKLLGVPVLGSILKKGFKEQKLIKDSKMVNPYIISFNKLSDQIYLLFKDKKLVTSLLTSVEPNEGIAPIAVNLALLLTKKFSRNVLLIDANLKNPLLSKILDVPVTPGLAEVLEEKATFERAVEALDIEKLTKLSKSADFSDIIQKGLPFEKIQSGKQSHLSILTTGKTDLNPVVLLDSLKMEKIIANMKSKYDAVIIICEHLMGEADASLLASKVDGVVLVIDEAKSRRFAVRSTLDAFRKISSNVLGVILNNRTYAIPKIFYDRI